MSKDSVLLAHILSQTQANISFLAAQDYISGQDATDMITRLAAAQTKKNKGNVDSITNAVSNVSISEPTPAPASHASPPPPARRNIPAPPPRVQKAKAIWAYNEDGREPNDLSFSAGEIIEIVDETNADWWTGKCRGKQGLFPSNHVEKITSSASSPPPPPAPVPVPTAAPWGSGPVSMPYAQPQPYGYEQPAPQYQNEKPAYRPFGAAYHGADVPPPAGGGNSVGLQHDAGEHEKKKSKYGKLGNTMATSAAGGVGFGAGQWEFRVFHAFSLICSYRCCYRKRYYRCYLLDVPLVIATNFRRSFLFSS
ncbi:SH3-domain-containing protein, partial [Panus rudis PR-1116 ss-1]